MRQSFAQHILNKVKDDYNHIALDFANTRANIWPEIASLFDYIRKGDKVLDLGCGNGRLVNLIKEKEGNYFGCDVSKNLIEIAQKTYPQESFQVTEPLKLPFNNNFFDAVYSIAVLHHIPSKEFRLEFLQEIRRVLKSKGTFVLTAWKPKKFFWEKLFWLSKGFDYGDIMEKWFGNNKGERYLHCFNQKELTNLIRQAGFEILKCGVIKNEKGNRQNLYFVVKKL